MPLLLGALPLRRFAQWDSSVRRPEMEGNPYGDINKEQKKDSKNSK